MSLNSLKEFLDKTEALTKYDEVKRDKNEAEAKNNEPHNKLQILVKEQHELTEKLKTKESEAGILREALKLKDKEVQSANAGIEVLKARILKLEGLKAIVEGKTLSEAEKAFLKATEEEIKKRADETFSSMKAEWVKVEKPKEVFKEGVKWLINVIETIRKPEAQYFLKDLVDADFPKTVEELIKSDVDRRLDAEFNRRVEEKSDQKALEKLNCLKSIEWPNWLKTRVEPRSKELEGKIVTNTFRLLRGPWTIRCDKCGTIETLQFQTKEIEHLLRTGCIMVDCANPNCKDFLGRHKIRTTLEGLIACYVTFVSS